MSRSSPSRPVNWILLASVAALLLAGAGYLAYRQYQAAQASARALSQLRIEAVARGDVAYVVSAAGLLLPEAQSDLEFMAPGTVAEVLVQEGDQVQAGQVLARLDDTALRLAVQQAEDALRIAELDRQKLLAGPDPGDIAVARANLRSANAAASGLLKGPGPEAVNIAQIQYDDLQAAYRSAAAEYNLQATIAAQTPESALSADELDRLKLDMEAAYYAAEIGRLQLAQVQRGADPGALSVAYARIAQAKAALEQLQAPLTEWQVKRADLTVAQARLTLAQARLRLAWTELTAPIAGVVARVNISAGEPAASAAPDIVLMDTSQYHLDLVVNEIDMARLSLGQTAAITVDALPGQPLTGRIDRLAPLATTDGGLVNYAVRITLTPADSNTAALRPGLSAVAQVVVAEAGDVVLVPNWAIRRDRQTGQVYASLKTEAGLVEVPITTGLRGDRYTEVLSGVQVGDQVAVDTSAEGVDVLNDGR